MSCSLSAGSARLVALTALAGTTVLAGPLVTALPAVAAPVAIEGYATDLPADAPATGPEHYFTPVPLSNGDTAYGINEEQPLAPLGQQFFDDEDYAPAEPYDDPDADRVNVVGERVGDHSVYWEPENAALAGYILSVFGASGDTDETRAVHWAVRSLSTAAAPAPELSGLEQAHLDRAASMIRTAREDIASLTPQDGDGTTVSFAPDGQPETLLVRLPEVNSATTVTLSGPVTFADGTTTRTIPGGDRDQHLELDLLPGISAGEISATVTATVPTTELTLLSSDVYRDLFIGGQDRTVTWSTVAGFQIDESSLSAEDAGTPDSDGADVTPVNSNTDDDAAAGDNTDDHTADDNAPVDDTGVDHTVDDNAPVDHTAVDDTTDAQNDNGAARPGPRGHSEVGDLMAYAIVADGEAPQEVTARLDAFVLFEESTSTTTEVVTETTTTGEAATSGYGYESAYADMVMANTGMGAPQAAGTGSAFAPMVLGGIAVAAGLGSWVLHRRKPGAPAATRE